MQKTAKIRTISAKNGKKLIEKRKKSKQKLRTATRQCRQLPFNTYDRTDALSFFFLLKRRRDNHPLGTNLIPSGIKREPKFHNKLAPTLTAYWSYEITIYGSYCLTTTIFTLKWLYNDTKWFKNNKIHD